VLLEEEYKAGQLLKIDYYSQVIIKKPLLKTVL
jgi:hypothetical protein